MKWLFLDEMAISLDKVPSSSKRGQFIKFYVIRCKIVPENFSKKGNIIKKHHFLMKLPLDDVGCVLMKNVS